MSLLDELKSASTSGYAEILSESKMLNERDTIRTRIPAINIALSGDIKGGLSSGLTFIAGPSRHFKSNIGLVLIAAYLKKYPDAICVFIDTEFGITKGYLKAMGVDPTRVLHVKCENIEQMKFEMANQLKSLREKKKKRQKFRVIFFIDSIGNSASLKEVEDAEKEKSAADMTRAKQLKSLFRIITPFFTTLDIPCVAVNHTYQTQEMFSKTVMSGGCVVEGTKIQMSDGSLKEVQDIEENEEVKTLTGHSIVTHTWNPDTLEIGEPYCYEVEFEDGYKVQCSDKHKFLIMHGDTPKWVEAKDLVSGMNTVSV